mmetsp:Transcript_91991/g.198851  ORF Transcript_91991/g.198851 Transcript_91991/m.198851 type:complete len:284 (+) Transcript_91991:929-1780(+)
MQAPADFTELAQLAQELATQVRIPEVSEELRVSAEGLHDVGEHLRGRQLHRLVGTPCKAARCVRADLYEAEEGVQKEPACAQADHRVVPEDGAVHVHVDDDLLPRLGVSPDDAQEVVHVRHGVQYVGLDQHVAVLRAMVNDGVTVGDVPLEAVHAIVEVDKVAGLRVPQVADARRVRGTAGVPRVQADLVVEEEDPRFHVVQNRVRRHRRYDLGEAVGFAVLAPHGVAGGGHEKRVRVQAESVVVDQVVLFGWPLVEVDVKNVRKGRQRLHLQAISQEFLLRR